MSFFHLHLTFHDLLFFMTGVAIPFYNVLEWMDRHFGIGKPVRRLGVFIKHLLLRNPQQEALYQAYKEKAMQPKAVKR